MFLESGPPAITIPKIHILGIVKSLSSTFSHPRFHAFPSAGLSLSNPVISGVVTNPSLQSGLNSYRAP